MVSILHKVIEKIVLPFHCVSNGRSEKVHRAKGQSILVKNDNQLHLYYGHREDNSESHSNFIDHE